MPKHRESCGPATKVSRPICNVKVNYLNVHVKPTCSRSDESSPYNMIVFTLCRAIVTGCYSQCRTGRRDEGCDHGRVDRSTRRLERAFFEREVTVVAKDLLGRVIVSGDGSDPVAVRLTEVEAYR